LESKKEAELVVKLVGKFCTSEIQQLTECVLDTTSEGIPRSMSTSALFIPILKYNLQVLMKRGLDNDLFPLDRIILIALWYSHCTPPCANEVSLANIEQIPTVKLALEAYSNDHNAAVQSSIERLMQKNYVIKISNKYKLKE